MAPSWELMSQRQADADKQLSVQEPAQVRGVVAPDGTGREKGAGLDQPVAVSLTPAPPG